MRKKIVVEIITIGDEILLGNITNTNVQWLGEQLTKHGFDVERQITVGDDRPKILEAFEAAASRADFVLVTGGLGPTKDDVTHKVLLEFFSTESVFNESIFHNIQNLYFQKGKELLGLNRSQAMVPAKATVLNNRTGTAPGLWMEKGKTVFVAMPGVPHEMKIIFAEEVLPKALAHFKVGLVRHQFIRTSGIPEVKLADMLEEVENGFPSNLKLAYLPSPGQVRLRLSAFGEGNIELENLLQTATEQIQKIASEFVYSLEDEEIEAAIGKLLISKGEKLATAESCTGGLLASKITDIAGCSAYYEGGIVSYSNAVKAGQLGVKIETLEAHGAVSEETACEMAENARFKYGADYGISTTGIAGPTGGVPGKPVGTVYIGYSDKHETFAIRLQLSTDRKLNTELTCIKLLNLLWQKLISG
ncbi:competence/damage-inducible protein A [Flammeovirgaceae bacterium SG7u.111]|nr:competence/damage-inducible protein A [Flammeovirgaceae bacterium SG7u.132]WPO35204.1 competence/damage-inducible protein A [Flammeovirgaceae bacterium SG7u.111]